MTQTGVTVQLDQKKVRAAMHGNGGVV